MQAGWDGKDVGVRVVVEGGVDEEGVAHEAELADELRQPADLVDVALRAVEDGRVEGVDDGVEHVGRGGREGGAEVCGQLVLVRDERVGEREAFVGVVSDHHLDRLVKAALREKLPGQCGHKRPVNDRTVGELAVDGVETHLGSVGGDDGFRRCSACVGKRVGVEKLEESVVCICTANGRSGREEAGGLENGLVEEDVAFSSECLVITCN